MIGLLVTLLVIGVLLYLMDKYIPMDPMIKKIIYVVVIVAVVLWLLNVFGVLPGDIPIPRWR